MKTIVSAFVALSVLAGVAAAAHAATDAKQLFEQRDSEGQEPLRQPSYLVP